MKTNKLEDHIKKTLNSRTIAPTASAWERLSVQLDAQVISKKRGLFFYLGVAASILVLLSVAFHLPFKNQVRIPANNEVVNQQIDTAILHKKIEKFKKEVPVTKAISSLVINNESQRIKRIKQNRKNTSVSNEVSINQKLTIQIVPEKETITVVAYPVKELKIPTVHASSLPRKDLKEASNKKIHIDSEDLLFAVTHSQQDVANYYNKKRLSRESLLKIINDELEKSNLKVNPKTILAEVEQSIHDAYIENNFLKSIRETITTLASAIASRNQ